MTCQTSTTSAIVSNTNGQLGILLGKCGWRLDIALSADKYELYVNEDIKTKVRA